MRRSPVYILGEQFDMRASISYSTYRAEQLPKQSDILGYQVDQISNMTLHGDVTSIYFFERPGECGTVVQFSDYTYTFTDKYGSILEESVTELEPQIWAKYVSILKEDSHSRSVSRRPPTDISTLFAGSRRVLSRAENYCFI